MVGREPLRVINLATDDPESLGIAGQREHIGEWLGRGSGLEPSRRNHQKLLAEWGTSGKPAASADYQSRVGAPDRPKRLCSDRATDASWIRQGLGSAPVMIACCAVVLPDVVAVTQIARGEKLMRSVHRGKAHV